MATAQEDIIDTLLAHHQQIKLLFGAVEATTGDHKQQLFEELVALLAVHEGVEETLIHPLAEENLPKGEATVSARLAEEQDAKEALARLYDLGIGHPQFDLDLATLRDAVAAHAESEELLEFGQLREVVDADQLVRMRSALAVAATLTPHPDAPATASANPLRGAPLAVFDNVRDALREAERSAS
jgi:hypothetical protein